MLVVSFNYRVGAYGFLGSGEGETNNGIMDIVKALEWTRKYIGKVSGELHLMRF